MNEPTADRAVIVDNGNRSVYIRLPEWPTATGSDPGDLCWFHVGAEKEIRSWISEGMPPIERITPDRAKTIYHDDQPYTWPGIANRHRSGTIVSADNELALAVGVAIDRVVAML